MASTPEKLAAAEGDKWDSGKVESADSVNVAYAGADLASANAAFIFCYALGMLVGPVMAGDAMARAPTFGLPLALGCTFAVYTVIVVVRMLGARDGRHSA